MKSLLCVSLVFGTAVLGHWPGVAKAGVAGEGPVCPSELRSETDIFFASDIVALDQVAFVLTWFDGVLSFDVSSTNQPLPLDTLSLGGAVAPTMIYENGILYCLTFEYDLVIVDASDPGNMNVMTVFEVPDMGDRSFSSTPGLSIQGGTLFVATATTSTSTQLLTLIDVSDPGLPVLISQFQPDASVSHWGDLIDVAGNRAYISGVSDVPGDTDPWGVFVLDISDPMAIEVDGFYDAGASPVRAMEADGSFIYLNTGELEIVDASIPDAPFLLSALPLPGDHDGLALDGNFAFVMGSLVDISNPATPSVVFHQANFVNTIFESDLVGTNAFAISDAGLGIANFNDCTTGCMADFNKDGSHDYLDISIFIQFFLMQDLMADLNEDGSFDFLDISLFIERYSAGC